MSLPNLADLENLVKAGFRTEWGAVTKCTTGALVTLVAHGDGRYTRSDGGSFLTDGFDPSDELTVTGWAHAGNNGVKQCISVTATEIQVPATGMADEAAGPAVTIAMGLPSRIKYDGLELNPPVSPKFPWLRETFAPDKIRAASLAVTAGKPMMRMTGFYWLTVMYPSKAGSDAISRLRGKFQAKIYPGRSLVYQGHTIRIQTASPKPFVEKGDWTSGALAFAFQADALNP